jgi:hypothetical protein
LFPQVVTGVHKGIDPIVLTWVIAALLEMFRPLKQIAEADWHDFITEVDPGFGTGG